MGGLKLSVIQDIKKLKSLDLREKLGWCIKKEPKKSLIISVISLMVFIFILSIPGIISLTKTHAAKNYITQSEVRLTKINATLNNVSNRLEKNVLLYKEINLYKETLNTTSKNYQELNEELNQITGDFENKDIKKVLYQFKADKDDKRVLFSDKLTNIEKNVGSINTDTNDVINISTYLISQYETFVKYKNSVEGIVTSKYNKLSIIKEKGKTTSVKNKSNQYFTTIGNNKTIFIDGLGTLKPYIIKNQGTFTLNELKDIKSKYVSKATLLSNTDSSISIFDKYWTELNEQYYTVVKNQYSDKSTDYVTENNPSYKEWQETESYQDTETYTERVYVGSRVVGDSKEDIYETQTKTRPVTKTRTITKDNGQSRTISVPYDVYSHYYTLEKHTTSGVTKSKEYVGKKHAKYDSSIRSWSYATDEAVGYVVWKQLWNDNAGILKGKNISPGLE